LLQKEFTILKSYQLPSYTIKYSKKGSNLKRKLFLHIPKILSAVKKEKKLVKQLIEKENICGIISDNRFGVVSKKIPSVYITHQLNVLSGKTTGITSKTHQKIIQQFTECWVPDIEEEPNFSGKLGHLKNSTLNVKYIGILSRFQPKKAEIKYHLLVLLSGPEPQRTLLENKLLQELKNYTGKILFVRGVISEEKIKKTPTNFTVVNYLLAKELEKAIHQSNIVISRSGYTTIMDLAVLGKKAFFIPTPGQLEQEYLAEIFHQKKITPFAKQHQFTLNSLSKLEKYTGFKCTKSKVDFNLFQLFKSK